jgi:hypothetical protein
MALENHPIKTRENPRNETGKLGDERAYWFHGIRFLNDCLVTIGLAQEPPFSGSKSSFLVIKDVFSTRSPLGASFQLLSERLAQLR